MRRATTALVMVLVLAACGGGDGGQQSAGVADPTTAVPAPETTASPAPTTTVAPHPIYRVATAEVARVNVYDEMGATTPTGSFAHPNPTYGSPRVFLVKQERGDWLEVYLPARPNGSTGWINKGDVSLAEHTYRILVELSQFRLTLFDKDQMVLQEPVAVGTSATPSATGFFYTTELIAVYPDEQYAYGPYAYGLSAYSEVLYSFGGGDGQMGIHGTGDPASIGRNVSNGCIRMTNEAITRLREMLPIGVPVEIRA